MTNNSKKTEEVNINDRKILLVASFIAIAIMIIDMQFPLGIGFGILYIIPIYLSFSGSRLKYIYAIGLLSLVCLIMGAVISPPLIGQDPWKTAINRILSLIALIAITFLGANQKKIKDKVAANNKELSRQSWIKNGQIALQESIKDERALEDIVTTALRELSSYIGADVAVMYLVEANKLNMVAGYSYPSNKKLEIEFNEGVVGRTAVEQKIIRLGDVIVERMSLESSFGDIKPTEILALPLIYSSKTIAVMEFAFPEIVDDQVIELLESIKDSLGVSMNSAISRERITKLLEETQRQAEELETQQEELKASNEELQQKSIELEYQQRELEATNEELEEQRASLEEQKSQLEDTNQELLAARTDIERKANDLATSSKYKSDFLANMSHELRTPLNSILILSKLLFEDRQSTLNDTQKENAKIIYDSGNDLLNLINDILDLSKVEAGRLEINVEEVPVANLANSLDRAFRAQIESKGLIYIVEIDPECPKTICTDNLRLEQIIKNFLSNAVKFTEQGKIKLSFKGSNKDSIAITVEDTGIGIPSDKKQLIFEAFQQVDSSITRRFGGTGLGLSISRSLATKLGGEIIIESQEAKGSVFTLLLPVNAANVKNEPVKNELDINDFYKPSSNSAINISDDRNEVNAGDKIILLFEADEKMAETISHHCHDLGYKCVISGSGENGLEDALKYNPSSIIVDTDLPDQNGLIVLDRLKNNPRTRHIPTYVVSDQEKRFESMKLGAVGMLDKNKGLTSIPEIIKKLEKIYEQGSQKVLLVEDNKVERDSIKKLINDRSIEVETAETATDAYELLKLNNYDCVILDLKLPDMTGFEFLDILRSDDKISLPPIIVYTGKDLNQEEQRRLEENSSSIVIKGVKSPERLLNEVTLFLHKMESEMSEDKQKILKYARHREQVYEGKKVLIVDDDIRNVYSLKQILQDRNMELFMASTGKEALEKLAEHPEIDIVLMDIMMPIMNGYEAMEAIRQTKNRKELPILALTAKAMAGDRDKCLSSGANDYIPKPIDPDRLLSLLRVWLSQ